MAETLSIGGCNNSFTLKMALRSTFLNIAPQTGKTPPACKFLANANKRQDTACCDYAGGG